MSSQAGREQKSGSVVLVVACLAACVFGGGVTWLAMKYGGGSSKKLHDDTPQTSASSPLPIGLETGFARPRPVTAAKNNDFDVSLTDWTHIVARGNQFAPTPQAWYDALVGPTVDSSNPPPVGIKGSFEYEGVASNPRIQFGDGIVYLRGRWIIPTTRRIRGVSPGGTMIPGGSSAVPVPITGEEIVDGGLVVFSDATRDIVFFTPDSTSNKATLVLRQWKATASGPDTPPDSEVPDPMQILKGNYYIIKTDSTGTKLVVEPVKWNNTPTTPDASIRAILVQVNANQAALTLQGVQGLPPVLPLVP
jgi:hypothetical protein